MKFFFFNIWFSSLLFIIKCYGCWHWMALYVNTLCVHTDKTEKKNGFFEMERGMNVSFNISLPNQIKKKKSCFRFNGIVITRYYERRYYFKRFIWIYLWLKDKIESFDTSVDWRHHFCCQKAECLLFFFV